MDGQELAKSENEQLTENTIEESENEMDDNDEMSSFEVSSLSLIEIQEQLINWVKEMTEMKQANELLIVDIKTIGGSNASIHQIN